MFINGDESIKIACGVNLRERVVLAAKRRYQVCVEGMEGGEKMKNCSIFCWETRQRRQEEKRKGLNCCENYGILLQKKKGRSGKI